MKKKRDILTSDLAPNDPSINSLIIELTSMSDDASKCEVSDNNAAMRRLVVQMRKFNTNAKILQRHIVEEKRKINN